MYDQQTLAYWQGRFTKSTNKLFGVLKSNNLITGQETAAIGNVVIDYPMLPAGHCPDNCPNPFEYYSTANPPVVTMPTLSLLFLNDLCIAYAWLTVNGYQIETVTNYIDMIRFRPPSYFPNGRYPQPLKALHIPDDALKNPRVDNMSLAFFNDARAFILSHEIGHILHHDPGNRSVAPAQSQAHEAAADAYATEVMRRAADPPIGLVVYFFAAAHWDPQAAETHPLTPQRLLALADVLDKNADAFGANDSGGAERVRFIAKNLRVIAQGDPANGKPGGLSDPDVQEGFRIVGMSTSVDSLKPRRPGELVAGAPGTGAAMDAVPFNGEYAGQYTRIVKGSEESLAITSVFKRSGDRVNGRYNFGLGDGTVDGVVMEGGKLYFNWSWGGTAGRGVLEAIAGGGFSGTWGYRDARSGGGTWIARRQ